MKNYTLDNMERNGNEYNFAQKTVCQSAELETITHIVTEEQEMRLDRISKEIYGTIEYVEELMIINGILNPHSIKKGDEIKLFQMKDLSNIQGNDPVLLNSNITLSNPNMNTQKDENRAPTENPGLSQVILDKNSKKIKIIDRLS